MKTAVLIFPHQLYRLHPALQEDAEVFLVEEHLFFQQFRFHQKKLVLHRASMQFYLNFLQQQGHKVQYIATTDPHANVRQLIPFLAEQGFNHLRTLALSDDWLLRRLEKAVKSNHIQFTYLPDPGFLNTPQELESHFGKRKTYFQTDFYIRQRKSRKILLEAEDQPLGGKWSFDDENRERFPAKGKLPDLPWIKPDKYIQEAQQYVIKHFPKNPGTTDNFGYAVTYDSASAWLDRFLKERFAQFGTYEDAMVKDENLLFHSVISPLLNIGLLEPEQVIQRTLKHAAKNTIPLNALEGFIRQIIGWREFIRIIYLREGRKQRTHNHFGFSRKIPASFWNGNTGIHPVDTVIRHTLLDGYTHHINRLMVMGNFMLLCEFNPDEVYNWFMEMYVDAYDWVMVPNVYGMTQFADGGLMTTKPYISGSNYLMKMGNWEKGPWQQTWDALFWRFMHVHRDLFSRNPRMGMLLKTFDKMDPAKRQTLLDKAEQFLQEMDNA